MFLVCFASSFSNLRVGSHSPQLEVVLAFCLYVQETCNQSEANKFL